MMTKRKTNLIQITREGGAEDDGEPLNLGTRVRELRKARGWTLERAARQAGLARSTLSKIENDQMSPTYEALKKLAVGLEISVPQLFTAPRQGQISGRMDVTAAGEGAPFATATYEHSLLAGSLQQKAMMPYTTRVRARNIDEFDGWVRHDGEEFLYVLTGVIMVYSEFYAPVELRRGDSAYYDAAMGHNVISTSPEDATILWVTALR